MGIKQIIIHSNLSEMKNKFLPTCLLGNYGDGLGEFNNFSTLWQILGQTCLGINKELPQIDDLGISGYRNFRKSTRQNSAILRRRMGKLSVLPNRRFQCISYKMFKI